MSSFFTIRNFQRRHQQMYSSITTRNVSEGNYKCLYPSQPALTNDFSYHNQKFLQGIDECRHQIQRENISEWNYKQFLQSLQAVHFSDGNYEINDSIN